ncbi:MAG: hypothetical protein L0Z53_17475, partial [Acidobacteriales bacterium]|nr:hypothetical protein [Terriglobales bacterium]
SDPVALFSESTTRFIVEVSPAHEQTFRELAGAGIPCLLLGKTTAEKRLRIAGANGEWIVWLPLEQMKEAWQRPLLRVMD